MWALFNRWHKMNDIEQKLQGDATLAEHVADDKFKQIESALTHLITYGKDKEREAVMWLRDEYLKLTAKK